MASVPEPTLPRPTIPTLTASIPNYDNKRHWPNGGIALTWKLVNRGRGRRARSTVAQGFGRLALPAAIAVVGRGVAKGFGCLVRPRVGIQHERLVPECDVG